MLSAFSAVLISGHVADSMRLGKKMRGRLSNDEAPALFPPEQDSK